MDGCIGIQVLILYIKDKILNNKKKSEQVRYRASDSSRLTPHHRGLLRNY